MRHWLKLARPGLWLVTLAGIGLAACGQLSLGLPSATLSAPAEACDHPFFPLRANARWTYSDGRSWRVTQISQGSGGVSVEVSLSISNQASEYKARWQCANGAVMGGVLATLYGRQSDAGGGLFPGGQTLVNTSGQFLAPADQFAVGRGWTQTFSEQLQVTSSGVANSTIERYTITGVAPVTFQGQSYPGLQISGSHVFNEAQITGNGMSQLLVHDLSFTLQLARGIGLTELTVTDTDSGRSDSLQLQAYDLP